MKTKYQNLENRVRPYSNVGSKFRYEYIRKIDDNGQPKMMIKEKINQYLEIQTYKDDNNIYKIIEQCGGIEKVDFNKGIYIDTRNIPKNYNDFMNSKSDVYGDWLKLPIEFKQQLGNNFDIFFNLAMTGRLDKISEEYNKNKAINPNTIKNELEKAKEIKNIGGINNEIHKPATNEEEKNSISI